MNSRTILSTMMLLCAGCAAGDVPEEQAGGTSELRASVPNETAWAEGTSWRYEEGFAGIPRAWVYRPASFSKKSPAQRGVVFHLVGCGQVPFQVAQGTGWPKVAEAHGLVVVVPEIIAPSHPNQTAPNTACYDFGSNLAMQPTRSSPDHKALIAAGQKVATAYPELAIDPRQIYLAGISAGATVAMQLACMAPDVFAGVASVAGPAIGADQSRAVMPPTVTAAQIRQKCTSYAGGASAQLKKQVYAIVSDDNGLPAGNPVLVGGQWTASMFAKQTYWDGDKYVPHAYHERIVAAMAPLFEATQTGNEVDLGFTGEGVGCPGGAASHDDTAETECKLSEAVRRSWRAKADVWTDSAGRKRIVHIKQDTLRHRWPVGPATALDRPVSPDRASLLADGYILPDGSFDIGKVNRAPNGTLGIIFFANDSFDFTTYLADFFADNNPRLPAE